jgi:hypothetical protein
LAVSQIFSAIEMDEFSRQIARSKPARAMWICFVFVAT